MAKERNPFIEFKKEDVSALIQSCFDDIMNIDWKIHHTYGQAYLLPEEYNKQMENLSTLRRLKGISNDDRYVIYAVLDQGRKQHNNLREYLYSAPRRAAQAFIGKKDVREFIFKRDGYKCLKCGKDHSLSIDHITPVHNDGLNELDNLQTLCSPCNSSKGTKIIDYRL